VAAKLQSDWPEVGITVNLKPLEQSVYLTQMRAPAATDGFRRAGLQITWM